MYPPPTKRADSVCKNVDPGSEHSNLSSSRYEIGFIKTYNRLGSLLLAESHSQKQSLSLKLKLKVRGLFISIYRLYHFAACEERINIKRICLKIPIILLRLGMALEGDPAPERWGSEEMGVRAGP